MQRKTVSDHETFSENPSTKKLKGVIVRDIIKQETLHKFVDQDSGDEKLFVELAREKKVKVDTLAFRKIFTDALPVIMKFKVPTIKVLGYILTKIEVGRDDVEVNMKECAAMCEYSSPVNVYKGLFELLQCEMIYRKAGHSSIYFINVNYIFNGNRI